VRRALYCSKIVSYAQGYMLLRGRGQGEWLESELGRHRADVARRMHHSQPVSGQDQRGLRQEPALENLLLDSFFSAAINKYQASWRKALVHAIELGVPTPAFSTALAFFDGFRTERLPANLLQAQRDYFGAHTYERTRPAARRVLPHQLDRPRSAAFRPRYLYPCPSRSYRPVGIHNIIEINLAWLVESVVQKALAEFRCCHARKAHRVGHHNCFHRLSSTC
jgi:hypothetical protein